MRTPPRALFAAALIAALLVAGCSGAPSSDGVIFADIHGLAVDPNDPQVLYVATHHGLFHGVNDEEWSKVSQETMDFMGFTMHPTEPAVMYASGHPAQATVDYHNLGVVKSVDGGRTWETMALRNEVDFHAMTISLAEPDTVWGWYYRDNHFYESTDAGLTWDHWAPTGAPAGVHALASSAANASTVYAAAGDGIHVSTDSGRSWRPLTNSQAPPGPATVIATTLAAPAKLWVFFPSVGFARSDDGGQTWTMLGAVEWGAQDGPAALAIDPTNPTVAYAASGRGAIFKTIDEGASWILIRAVGAANGH
jgi:photosystem II stability/assembly factor-like uncharacterized protein